MKIYIISFLILVSVLGIISCHDSFLNQEPTASINAEALTTQAGVEGLLIGAYSQLNGQTGPPSTTFAFSGGMDNWIWGTIKGGDANKGSNAGDITAITQIATFQTSPTNSVLTPKWQSCYEGIACTNQTLLALAGSTSISATDHQRITGEARFLRALYHFELKKIWGNVPYIDETVSYSAGTIDKVGNKVDIYPKIEADLQFAATNLPATQAQAGRANSWAAKCLLAKVYMFEHKYNEAKALFDQIIANGVTTNGLKYALTPSFPFFFSGNAENNSESVFAFQAVANSGSANNATTQTTLNFPYNGGPAGCCGFEQPSFDLANSFRVDATGLPYLDGTYRSSTNAIVSDMGISASQPYTVDTKAVDPRIDFSIGRRGIPYLDWGVHPGPSWIRDQAFGGPYSPKKFVFSKANQALTQDGSSWKAGSTGLNVPIIRFADVLLMAAEAEVEVGSLATAQTYVNMIRKRAANPAAFVMNNSAPAANYKISLYTTPWTDQTTARNAVRFERKLELSGEGHRFFDLVRWGIAATEMNSFFAYESQFLPNTWVGGKFVNGHSEIEPIPQSEIDKQVGVLVQNPGY